MDRKNLVLSRRVDESIEIGTTTIKVIKLKGGRVKLLIQADEKIKIVRSELLDGKPRAA